MDYHRRLIEDSVRVESFLDALDRVVTSETIVYDIGAGLGILGLYAAKIGAKRVYLVESNRIIEVAREVARYNHLKNVEFIQGDARYVEVPEKGDVAVCEGIGNFFVTDEMQSVYRAIPRFLKDGGRIIPSRITLYVAPAFVLTFPGVRFWEETVIRGLSFKPVAGFALNRAYIVDVPRGFLIAEPQIYKEISVPDVPDELDGTMHFVVSKTGMRLTGFIGWFSADLTPGVRLSTSPGIRTHWGQMLFPVREIPLQRGDEIELRLTLTIDETYRNVFRWRGRVIRGGVELLSFDHNSERRYAKQASKEDY